MLHIPKKSLFVLIDPDKFSKTQFEKLLKYDDKIAAFLVGGSLLLHSTVDETVGQMKELTDKEVYLFPGNFQQLTAKADGILFLSLLSGRNPEFLIGQHVSAAPIIKSMNLKTIPTAYILIDGGRETSVSYISNTKPIPADKFDLVIATSLAAQYQGKQLLYLEAGSGAEKSVSPELIKELKKYVDLPIIVGGGIRKMETVELLYQSGADYVVVGNRLEEDNSFFD